MKGLYKRIIKKNHKMKLPGIFLAFIPLIFLAFDVMAQRPTHIPGDDEPLRVFESVENIIFYLVLPLIIIVLYVIWRRRLNRERAEKEKESGMEKDQKEN